MKIYPDQIAPEVKRLDTFLLWKNFDEKPEGKAR